LAFEYPVRKAILGGIAEKGGQVRAIKTVGLCALMTLMAMAFVGASPAMAESTTLCKADESPCASPVGHVHETSIGKAQVLTSIGSAECNVLFLGDVKSEGSPLVISGNFTYTNCVLGGSKCTATEENGPAELKVLKEGHETAKVTYEDLVHIVCAGFIDCSYVGTGLEGTAKGPLLSAREPDNGEVWLLEKSLTKEAGGFLCPKTAKLDDITMTLLTAAYLGGERVKGSTVLCAADESPCVESSIGHVHETSVGKAALLSTVGTTECNVLYLGNVVSFGAPTVLKGNFTYTNCELSGSKCTATEENGPAKLKVLKFTEEEAEVTGEGLVHLICPETINCSYNGTGLKGTAKGELKSTQKNGEVTLTEQSTTKEAGGLLCPKTAKLDITTTPLTATYISS
jgi:hypothetical protein